MIRTLRNVASRIREQWQFFSETDPRYVNLSWEDWKAAREAGP